MKGVKNKVANGVSNDASNTKANAVQKDAQGGGKGKRRAKTLTAGELRNINRRLDQCLPMETPEWQRVEQLLMQISEFAPRLLVYEAGMAVALYADDQARRAYLLGAEDARAQAAAQSANDGSSHGRGRLVSA